MTTTATRRARPPCKHLMCGFMPAGQCALIGDDLERAAAVWGVEREPGETDLRLLDRALCRAKKDRLAQLVALASARRGSR